MNSGIVKESTFAQSGAVPTLAFSSRRACSVVVMLPPMMFRSSRHSGCFFAQSTNNWRKPLAIDGVDACGEYDALICSFNTFGASALPTRSIVISESPLPQPANAERAQQRAG